LHTSILHVCQTAVDLLADSSRFPDEWLFKHRWGKGKKDAPTTLPNGEKITFLTVGGRTSCVVPSVQKKTGAVAGDIKKEDSGEKVIGDVKEKAPNSKKRKAVEEAENLSDAEVKLEAKTVNCKGGKNSSVVEKVEEKDSKPKKRKVDTPPREEPAKSKAKTKKETKEKEQAITRRRGSGRVSKA
jgi:formamidopyrimidine-DNA glycosylase